MTLDERVEAQRAIESVYYMHPIGAVVDSPDSTPANGTMDVNDAAGGKGGAVSRFSISYGSARSFRGTSATHPPVDNGSIC